MVLVGDLMLETRLASNIAEDLISHIRSSLIKENTARYSKRLNKSCPYNRGGLCSELEIRCGERQQYHTSGYNENDEAKLLPHRCNYDTLSDNIHVLVVDDEPALTKFYASCILEEFNPDNVDIAGSVSEAEGILKEGKTLNKQYFLVISDIKMFGGTGYDLVNMLVERNYNARIVLVSGTTQHPKPPIYFGDMDIVPGDRVVSATLQKPLHVSTFLDMFDNAKSSFTGRMEKP